MNVAPLVVRNAAELDRPTPPKSSPRMSCVDAVLGTGFRPPVSALYAAAIARMNASAAPVVAVDIPSGADADAMQPQQGTIARADAVVTFTAPRPAHVFAALTNGPTVIAPIGSPPEAITSELGLPSQHSGGFFGPAPASPARKQQRQLRTCTRHRRIARQSGRGCDGRILRSARGRGPFHRGDAEIRARDRCQFSSRINDRAARRNRRWNDRYARP